jgi:hypothetical protein
VVIIRPKEPFFEWADSHDNEEPRARSLGVDFLTSTILVSDEHVAMEQIKQHFRSIFEEMLLGWCRSTDLWPRDRSWTVFQRWFDVQIVESVFEFADEEPI